MLSRKCGSAPDWYAALAKDAGRDRLVCSDRRHLEVCRGLCTESPNTGAPGAIRRDEIAQGIPPTEPLGRAKFVPSSRGGGPLDLREELAARTGPKHDAGRVPRSQIVNPGMDPCRVPRFDGTVRNTQYAVLSPVSELSQNSIC
jgi:hypothetical protein